MSSSDNGEGFALQIGALEQEFCNETAVTSGKARLALRKFLFARAGQDELGGSIGDALSQLSSSPAGDVLAACTVLRALAVDGLMPNPNSANQMERSIVSLCEKSVPDVVSFLRIDRKLQTFEKFVLLSKTHLQLTELLSPIRTAYGDVDALIAARNEIIGCMQHSIVRRYAGPFGLRELRSTIEAILGKLKRVAHLDSSLLTDVEEVERTISSAKAEAETVGSFLNNDFLIPFLNTCERVVRELLASQRGRFSTRISAIGKSPLDVQKKYPLHQEGREIHVSLPLVVTGPGMATGVNITALTMGDDIVIGTESIALGNVQPGQFSVVLDVMVLRACLSFSAILNVEWGEIGSAMRSSELFEFRVAAQSTNIEWSRLEYETPYNAEVAEGEQFVGREEKVRSLAARLLSRPMQSFYITGQKRVGKTSLALAAAEFARNRSSDHSFDFDYILWGSVAHESPSVSLRQLASKLKSFLLHVLPTDLRSTATETDDSLTGLIQLAQLAQKVAPARTFGLILDEFDEIHPELYLHGNLAETFFANLRALSRCRNVCIVLVGGENMPFIMERQGQKLNNFARINLSYFSRESEWGDFQQLARKPTESVLQWHEDAVAEVFNVTHGNPYFAKIVCGAAYSSAVSQRDSDISANEIKLAIEREVSALGSNSFAHLWQDGIPKAPGEREPDVLRRMRTLVALARCIRRGMPTTGTNIASNRASTRMAESEIIAVVNDFVRRDVLVERGGNYDLVLPLFRMWLADVGINQLVADALSEEITDLIFAEENAAAVHSEEVVGLSKEWPTYRGKHIGTDEIKVWYQQAGSLRDQRILFKLLQRTLFFSESLVRERLKAAHTVIRPSLPEFIIRKRGERRFDLLLTYVDGPGKSGAGYASNYAEENGIAAACVVSQVGFAEQFKTHADRFGNPAAVLIVDDIAATGRSFAANITKFVSENAQVLRSTKLRAITLVATARAQQEIIRTLASMEFDIEFRSCEILRDEQYAFSTASQMWENQEQAERAKALCVDLGSQIYPQNPLGYGDLGLLVIFPTTVPNNSLPILHSHARIGSAKPWTPLFPRPVN
ncbi:MAG TPA: ATP-binding protein [Rhizomicrobium sp.]|nr:ATP-binding protein [Rhizomicrobium sp.]